MMNTTGTYAVEFLALAVTALASERYVHAIIEAWNEVLKHETHAKKRNLAKLLDSMAPPGSTSSSFFETADLEHSVMVDRGYAEDGIWVAVCVCGWEGSGYGAAAGAVVEARAHIGAV